jgi:hypothetical protein
LPDAPLGFNHQGSRLASLRPDLDLERSRPRRTACTPKGAPAFHQTGGDFVPPVAVAAPKSCNLDWRFSTCLADSKTVVFRPRPEWVPCCGAEAPHRSARWVLPNHPEGWLCFTLDCMVSRAETRRTLLPVDRFTIPRNGFLVRGIRVRAPKCPPASPEWVQPPSPEGPIDITLGCSTALRPKPEPSRCPTGHNRSSEERSRTPD